MIIADLLTQSRSAHARYRHAQQIQKAPATARKELQIAYQFRSAAHHDDPEMTDSAWSQEPPKFIDAELMAFYRSVLEPELG